MKVFVTGVSGQLGHDVVNEAVKRGHKVIASGRSLSYSGIQDGSVKYVQLDITDHREVMKQIVVANPDVIIHCAAYTNVDEAEEDSYKCLLTNVFATERLADAADVIGAKFVYISSDYIFRGTGNTPYKVNDYDIWQADKPNYYGYTKLRGEAAVEELTTKYFVIRTSWVFGLNGKNFVKTLLNLSKDEISVVDDQIGRPTYTVDLAKLICDMIVTDKYGVYHATNTGDYISWADFAEEIYRLAQRHVKIYRVSSEEYQKLVNKNMAKRPLNSRLDTSKLTEEGFEQLPDWHNALCRYIQELRRCNLL